MFDKTACDGCGQCLQQCPYIDLEPGSEPAEWQRLMDGEPVQWLYQCVTCFACNEICPQQARPFDLILKRMEEKGDYVDPELLDLAGQMFSPKTAFSPPHTGKRALSLCTIYAKVPWAFSGRLFDGFTHLRGTHFFCNLLYPHLGNASRMRDSLPALLEKYAAVEAEEIIFVHDDCYSVMTEVAPQAGLELPFRPVHLFEYLRDYLNSHRKEIRPLGMKVAYQRPCASRLTPWKEPWLDEIFARIGVERVQRVYDREKALCCGQDMGGMQDRGNKFPAFRRENIADAVRHGAEAMVYLCPMCLDALYQYARAENLENWLISDLCRKALGEELPDAAYADYQ